MSSGRLVAAMTTTLWWGSKPSIRASSWATSRFRGFVGVLITLRRDAVDLVEEDDGPLLRLSRVEHRPQDVLAVADPLTDNLRSGDGVEGRVGLLGDDAGEEGLPRAGVAGKQDALNGRAPISCSASWYSSGTSMSSRARFLTWLEAGEAVEGQVRVGLAEVLLGVSLLAKRFPPSVVGSGRSSITRMTPLSRRNSTVLRSAYYCRLRTRAILPSDSTTVTPSCRLRTTPMELMAGTASPGS